MNLRRGSIVDISSIRPRISPRLDLLTQKWDSIHAFNAETQRSMDVIQEVRIFTSHRLATRQGSGLEGAQAKDSCAYEKDEVRPRRAKRSS